MTDSFLTLCINTTAKQIFSQPGSPHVAFIHCLLLVSKALKPQSCKYDLNHNPELTFKFKLISALVLHKTEDRNILYIHVRILEQLSTIIYPSILSRKLRI